MTSNAAASPRSSRPPAPGGALGEALTRRVAAAGPDAAEMLLVAAASSDRALVPVIAACRDLGIEDSALERCEAAGLLETANEELRLAHPLLRGVVYGGAAPGDRRRAHRALADHAPADSGPGIWRPPQSGPTRRSPSSSNGRLSAPALVARIRPPPTRSSGPRS